MATATAKDRKPTARAAAPAKSKPKAAPPPADEDDEEPEDEETEDDAAEETDDEPADEGDDEEADEVEEEDEEPAPKPAAKAKTKPAASAAPAPKTTTRPNGATAAGKPTTTAEKIEAARAKLDAFTDEQKAKLQPDESDLLGEFKSQAASFLVAAAKHNSASLMLANVKIEHEQVVGEQSAKHRSDLESAGGKVTEKAINDLLTTDPRVLQSARKLAYAQFQKDQYGSIQRAWEHKRDMLIQMGSTERAAIRVDAQGSDAPAAGPAARRQAKPAPVDDDTDEGDDTDDEPVTRRPAKTAKEAKPAKAASKKRAVRDEDEDDHADD